MNIIHKTVSHVIINGVFPVDVSVTVRSQDDLGRISLIDKFNVTSKSPSKSQRVGTRTLNKPIQKLFLEFSPTNKIESNNEHAKIRIHSIQIKKPYDRNLTVATKSLSNYFEEGQTLESSSLPVSNLEGFSSIVSKDEVSESNIIRSLLLGALFFFSMLFLFRHVSWSEIPAFKDMSLGREISSADEFGTINGLRGIAAIMVLLSHTAPGFHANGVGIAILFVISGFLLSKPFVIDPGRAFSWENVEKYLVKRIKRILPMYYLYVFILYVVPMELEKALRHFLFVQAEGHLWPMTQIFTFYILLPFLLMLTSGLYRLNRFLPIIALFFGAYASLEYMKDWFPFYNGSYYHNFFLYSFLYGVLASYIQYDLISKNSFLVSLCKTLRQPLALVGLTMLTLTVLWTGPYKAPIDIVFHYLTQFYVKCALAAVIIVLAINTPKTWFNLIVSNWVFRSVGVIGFSFYILHGLGMQIVLNSQKFLGNPNPSDRSWSFMLMAFAVTYILSVLSYSYVERPFFGFKKITNDRDH